jgi:hypothetical protein
VAILHRSAALSRPNRRVSGSLRTPTAPETWTHRDALPSTPLNSSSTSSRRTQPTAVRLSRSRTLGISPHPFHVPRWSRRSRISYCTLDIGIRNVALRPLSFAPWRTNHRRPEVIVVDSVVVGMVPPSCGVPHGIGWKVRRDAALRRILLPRCARIKAGRQAGRSGNSGGVQSRASLPSIESTAL